MMPSTLLKSCATPPASWPRLSSRSRSARVLSRSPSASSARRAVMSRMAAVIRRSWSVSMADREISAGKMVPSRRRPDRSRPLPIGRESFRRLVRSAGCLFRDASGTRISTCRPTSSSREYPNSASAWAFTSTMRPPSSTHTMASGAASRIPRNRSSARFSALMSRISDATPTMVPELSTMGDTVAEMGITVPSLRTTVVSRRVTRSPRAMVGRTSSQRSALSPVISRSALRPTISAAV